MSKHELIDAYISHRINRRAFIQGLTALGVSSGVAASYAVALQPANAADPECNPNDFYTLYDFYGFYTWHEYYETFCESSGGDPGGGDPGGQGGAGPTGDDQGQSEEDGQKKKRRRRKGKKKKKN